SWRPGSLAGVRRHEACGRSREGEGMHKGEASRSNRRNFLVQSATLTAAVVMPGMNAQSRETNAMLELAQAGTTAAAAPNSTLAVKSVERLVGSSTSFAYAVQAGPWIFPNGPEA